MIPWNVCWVSSVTCCDATPYNLSIGFGSCTASYSSGFLPIDFSTYPFIRFRYHSVKCCFTWSIALGINAGAISGFWPNTGSLAKSKCA